jgi:arsenite-transporting ATPase
MEIDSRPKVVISGLTAMEVDAEEEFEALKKQYAGDIAKFLESMSSQFDLTFDREVIERILDLSPPGLDEVMALTRVTALLASGNYDVLVLDSASTGHLIRLLELPEIIDQWLKIFFDLFLKYQQIFRLTKFSQELVTLSKNLKRLKQSLSNPATAALYAVSIPTDMAYEETRDLLAACKRLGIGVARLFLNLFTPPSDCGLCSALYRRESLVRDKFQQSLPGKDFTLVYRCGETRGLRRLGELGQALYQSADVESRVYAHWRQHRKPASPGLGTTPGR